jgi:hypothetical protein
MDEVIYELSMGGWEPIWFLSLSRVVLEKFERRHILGKFGIQVVYVCSNEWRYLLCFLQVDVFIFFFDIQIIIIR